MSSLQEQVSALVELSPQNHLSHCAHSPAQGRGPCAVHTGASWRKVVWLHPPTPALGAGHTPGTPGPLHCCGQRWLSGCLVLSPEKGLRPGVKKGGCLGHGDPRGRGSQLSWLLPAPTPWVGRARPGPAGLCASSPPPPPARFTDPWETVLQNHSPCMRCTPSAPSWISAQRGIRGGGGAEQGTASTSEGWPPAFLDSWLLSFSNLLVLLTLWGKMSSLFVAPVLTRSGPSL